LRDRVHKLSDCAQAGSAWNAESHVTTLDWRFRHILAFTIAAVITAATLRHVFHTYAGLPREEIRTHALLALGAFLLLIVIGIFFRRWQWSGANYSSHLLDAFGLQHGGLKRR
jgi:hypothetical protein